MFFKLTGKSLFPISYLSSQLGMTGLMVALGLFGQAKLAADVGIVQAAALALFFGFSGNARSVIFKSQDSARIRSYLVARLILIVPLGAVAFYLGSVPGGVSWLLSVLLILRKSVEWLGELHLSQAERDQDKKFCQVHLLLQSGLLVLAVGAAALDSSWFLPALAAWAIIPIIPSLSFLWSILVTSDRAKLSSTLLLPHLGSSAVTGIGVYVFRLILLLLVGREDAGTLFTAFAIGGLLGSVFSFGFGPSMVLNEQRTGQKEMSQKFRRVLFAVTLSGIALTAATILSAPGVTYFGQGLLFWQALGFSLLGSVVMVFAQRQRLRDLQHGTQDDVFAPDVLVNIIIVIFIPTVFFVFGLPGMTWLYLFNACVGFVFYWMTDVDRAAKIVRSEHRNLLRALIAFFIVVPVFVTMESGLFRSAELLYDSGRILARLPIPLSVAACYLGIALLGNYRRANLALAAIFSTFVLMVFTTVSTTFETQSSEREKLYLLLQYILPMFALVLGMMFEDLRKSRKIFEKVAVVVIALIVPAQLIVTWQQQEIFLTPYLYAFSIYQHLQYVPLIFVACYIFALFSLWSDARWRAILLVLAPILGVYAAASGSTAALGLGLLGGFALLGRSILVEPRFRAGLVVSLIPLLFIGSFAAYALSLCAAAKTENGCFAEGSRFPSGITNPTKKSTPAPALAIAENNCPIDAGKRGISSEEIPVMGISNFAQRLEIWSHYAAAIMQSPRTFLLGKNQPPEREAWTSAHNFYLDFTYNFGVLSILPILALLAWTAYLVFTNRADVYESRAHFGLCFVVFALLLFENNMKVGLRMPYSGIITFFLWGLLLARLNSFAHEVPILPVIDKEKRLS